MSQQQAATSTHRRVWIVAITALLATLLVPYLGLLAGTGAAYYAHRQGVAVARNVLVAVVLVMAVLALTMTPFSSVGPR